MQRHRNQEIITVRPQESFCSTMIGAIAEFERLRDSENGSRRRSLRIPGQGAHGAGEGKADCWTEPPRREGS
jgi:hypothetical protein